MCFMFEYIEMFYGGFYVRILDIVSRPRDKESYLIN